MNRRLMMGLLAAALWAQAAGADTFLDRGYGTHELGVSARSRGLGGAGAALATGPYSLVDNPAALAFDPALEFKLDPGTGPVSVTGSVNGRQLTFSVTTRTGSHTETRELAEPPGYADGYSLLRSEMGAALDTRRAPPAPGSGFRVQGRTEEAAKRLVAAAQALERAGAFALVLELVPAPLAEKISKMLSIPTIGIGAGPGCDGQVQVLHDMMGMYDDFLPKHAKRYAHLAGLMRDAATTYAKEVRGGAFPGPEHTFDQDMELPKGLDAPRPKKKKKKGKLF